MTPVDVIIPTFNNPDYLIPCVQSMLRTRQMYPIHIIVVNNGTKGSCDMLGHWKEVTMIEAGHNRGWCGGLNQGLQHSQSEFVMFANDDIVIPRSSSLWLRQMMEPFRLPEVAQVGPSTNVVMGSQNIFDQEHRASFCVPFLIGFCVLNRRADLDLIREGEQYADEQLPGGDDLDFGIRLRRHGKWLLCDRETFVYHHGFKTGIRVHGSAERGGWNSDRMTDATTNALIRKHGLRAWLSLWQPSTNAPEGSDMEGDRVRELLQGVEGVGYELGGGGVNTRSDAVNVDRVPRGEGVPFTNQTSRADQIVDLNGTFPMGASSASYLIARQVIEHLIDPLWFLQECYRVLRPDGVLVVTTPNQALVNGIPLNGEHLHAFTSGSLTRLAQAAGFFDVRADEGVSRYSLVMVLRKGSGTTTNGNHTLQYLNVEA